MCRTKELMGASDGTLLGCLSEVEEQFRRIWFRDVPGSLYMLHFYKKVGFLDHVGNPWTRSNLFWDSNADRPWGLQLRVV